MQKGKKAVRRENYLNLRRKLRLFLAVHLSDERAWTVSTSRDWRMCLVDFFTAPLTESAHTHVIQIPDTKMTIDVPVKTLTEIINRIYN